jgi:2-methylisocitrate lyase-like PEP mutase family enzyme
MTGAGTTASMLGEPDLAIATLNDFVQNGSMIVRVAKGVPVICGLCPVWEWAVMVDADTGFGGPINAARTVQRYEQSGIAALHIEDQSTSSIRSAN